MNTIDFSKTEDGIAQSERMIACRKKLGFKNAREFSNKYIKQFSYSKYQKHEKGERLLSVQAAKEYAEIFGVDWEWLKNGSGNLKNDYYEESSNPIVDYKHLKNVIQAVEEWMSLNNKNYSPESKTELIMTIYKETAKREDSKQKAVIVAITDLIARKAV